MALEKLRRGIFQRGLSIWGYQRRVVDRESGRGFGSMAFTIVLHCLWSAGGLDDISLTKAWRLSLLDISILWLLAAAD